jgi:flagellar biosynthesis/type III secretory pathway chaperone
MLGRWQEVLAILSEMADKYLAMTALAEQKRDALVNVRIGEINGIIKQEEALIKEINELERRRAPLVETIAREGKWPRGKVKLLDLVEKAPPDLSDKMQEIGQRLADIVMQIALLNGINNNLLKQAMQIIDYNINILSRAQATPFYGAGGGERQRDGKGNLRLNFLDRKA